MPLKSYTNLTSACMIGAMLAVSAAIPGQLRGAPPFLSPPQFNSSTESLRSYASSSEPSERPSRSLCPVPPLPPITDSQARAFESFTGPVVDTHDLRHRAYSALIRFINEVRSVGGIITLKSAYRPPAYQAHLQQVWDRWMQLRNNHSAACQDLRAEVETEFNRHQLIESQRPVNDSDHTRGLAFDASVTLPRILHIGRGRRRRVVNLDKLARRAGLRRPDIRHDPVHFKFIG